MFLGAGEVIGNMRAPAYPPSRPGGWIGLALLLAVTPRRQAPSSEDSVTVDVLTPQQFEAANSSPVAETRAAP